MAHYSSGKVYLSYYEVSGAGTPLLCVSGKGGGKSYLTESVRGLRVIFTSNQGIKTKGE